METKYQRRMSEEEVATIVGLHREGFTSTEISHKVDFSSTAIRLTLIRHGLKPNVRGAVTPVLTCVICGKIFEAKSWRDKTCSSECLKKRLSEAKTKYSELDFQKVLELKAAGCTIRDIETKTGVNINKIKEICKERGALLDPSARQEHALKGKLDKDPEALVKMRQCITQESRDQQSVTIRRTFSDNKGHYHEIFSNNSKNIWSELRSDPDNYREYIEKRTVACREGKLGITLPEFDALIEKIKTRYENKEGSVCGLAVSEGLDANTVSREFHKRGWSDLVDGGVSTPEKEVLSFVKEILPGVEIIENSRSLLDGKVELDIFIPSKKFAIEYNGLYYHSEACSSWKSRKEQKKYEMCQDRDYRLFIIFADEWENPQKRELVKVMIRHRLGMSVAKKIRAGDLNLVRLQDGSEFSKFFDRNHLDGHAQAVYAYALVDGGGKIYSAMSFRKTPSDDWEIARFATDYDYLVYGAASKLLSQFRGKLITFSDNRFSSGATYRKLGFSEVQRESSLNYYYTDFKQRIKRQHCRKLHNLSPEDMALYDTEAKQAAAGFFSVKLFGYPRPLYRIEGAGTKKWERIFE